MLFLLWPRNKEVLREAMVAMITKSQSELQVLKTNAQQRARSRYHHTVAAEKLKAQYLQVLNLPEEL